MRRVVVVVCAMLWMTSCGRGGAADGDSGRLPGAPGGVTAVAGSATSVHVMWNALPDGSGVRAYRVYRGTTEVAEVPGSQHMVDVTRLRPSTGYAFTVRARGADGSLGPRSREVRATTPASVAADRSAPTRPVRPGGRAVGSRAAQLSWGASTDDRRVSSYDVYQGDAKIHSVGGNQTATVVTGLRPGTRYVFTVRARDAADNVSPASAAVRLTMPGGDDGRDTAPTGFTAGTHEEGGAYYLDLAWDPPQVGGVVTEYQVLLDAGTTTSLVWGGTPPKGRSAYSFCVGRERGAGHRVRLRARLPDGTWGGWSAVRSVTTGA
ncbi:fibronectin type III domain-containing protein [Streptomyces sp. NPDC021562]|uniref:fibronectin type III domain-containing protein n=1 Tax=Streptomyces sp. NPDC021562 TaxID=3155121 RepID=UPI0033E0F4B3